MFIGGHVSAAGGLSQAYARIQAIGGNTVQVFSASPRVWKRNMVSDGEVAKCLELQKTCGIERTIIHAIYLVNLASENRELVEKSRDCLEFDLRVDAAIQGNGVVVHLGSHQGRGFSVVKEQLVTEIKTILGNTPPQSHFLIENSAGQQGKIGSDFNEIKELLEMIASPRLGWCLDTCHAFAAGYDLTKIAEPIARLGLWETLWCIHVNDSRDPAASGRDRHENLGEGQIGSATLRTFLALPQVRQLPLILEVPGMDGKSGPDAENIQRLQNLVE